MNERTRSYLQGRFGDHYRRLAGRGGSGGADGNGDGRGIEPPPAANEREWGYIPWRAGGTTMVRHESWLDVTGGDTLSAFLAREAPRHVYFSAGRYDDPGADSMGSKGWRASDLIFDLDADHLPAVDPGTDPYAEMLSACKDALLRLLDLLEADFGFEELTIAFSGGRGYHVHVRDEEVTSLGRPERREIVEYVHGPDLAFEDVVRTEAVGGLGLQTPADKRSLPTGGGWGARVHARLVGLAEELRGADEATALARLREFEGIGAGKAEAILRAVRERGDELRAGNIDLHPATVTLARRLFERTLAEEGAPIDEPVTTDINRLIRLPGSLHGGSGLAVRRIDRDALAGFDPLVDAVPATFHGNEIGVEITDGGRIEFDGDTFKLPEGETTVREALGVFLMTRGRAEKTRER
jgi:DNA primase small subunit